MISNESKLINWITTTLCCSIFLIALRYLFYRYHLSFLHILMGYYLLEERPVCEEEQMDGQETIRSVIPVVSVAASVDRD